MNKEPNVPHRKAVSFRSIGNTNLANAKKQFVSQEQEEYKELKSSEGDQSSSKYKQSSVKRSFTAQNSSQEVQFNQTKKELTDQMPRQFSQFNQQSLVSTQAFSSPNKFSLSFCTEKGYQTRSMYRTKQQHDQNIPDQISEEDCLENSNSFANLTNSPALSNEPLPSFRQWEGPSSLIHTQMRGSLIDLKNYQKLSGRNSLNSLDSRKQSYFSSNSFRSSSTFKRQQESPSPIHSKKRGSPPQSPIYVKEVTDRVMSRLNHDYLTSIVDPNSTQLFKSQRSDRLLMPMRCQSNEIEELKVEEVADMDEIQLGFFQCKKYEEPWFFDPEKCIKYLIRQGIKGKKFEFSTTRNTDYGKDVIIRLSFDRQHLVITRPKDKLNKQTLIPIQLITGFIYGGFSLTFKRYYEKMIDHIRGLQKHFLNDQTKNFQDLSQLSNDSKDEMFYAWECVSLTSDSRTYDFRISDRYNCEEKYILINAIQGLLKAQEPNYPIVTIPSLRTINIKQKISFEALRQGKTIVELFFTAIEKTIEQLHSHEYSFPKFIRDPLKEEKQRFISKYLQALSYQQMMQEYKRSQQTVSTKESLKCFVDLCQQVQGLEGDEFFQQRDQLKQNLINLRIFLHEKQLISFQDKVLDIKIKRKLLEMNRYDALLNFVAQKTKFKLQDEMNPKLFSKSLNYYCHSHNLLYSLMRYYLEKEEVQNKWIQAQKNLIDIKSFESQHPPNITFLQCLGIKCKIKKEIDPKKILAEKNKKKMAEADKFVNEAMLKFDKIKQMEIIRANLLKLKQYIQLQEKDGYFQKLRTNNKQLNELTQMQNNYSEKYSQNGNSTGVLKKSEYQVRKEYISVYGERAIKRFKSQYMEVMETQDFKKAMQKSEAYVKRQEICFSPNLKKIKRENSIDHIKKRFRQAFQRKRTQTSSFIRLHTVQERSFINLEQ